MYSAPILHSKGGIRGQSMAELAVFGSLMLLVLGFLVRYAISYTNRQALTMETFRTAMSKAQAGDTNTTAMFKDYPTADPTDEFGTGPRQVQSSEQSVVWSNETGAGDEDPMQSQLVYRFQSGSNGETIEKRYTTWGFHNMSLSQIDVEYPFYDDPVTIAAPEMEPWDDYGNLTKKQLRVLVLKEVMGGQGQCGRNGNYCPTDIVRMADIENPGDGTTETILQAHGSRGAVSVDTRDPNEGQIDRTAGGPNDIEHIQGPRSPSVTYTREDTMTVVDSGNTRSATINYNDNTQTHFDIILNKGATDGVTIDSTESTPVVLNGNKK